MKAKFFQSKFSKRAAAIFVVLCLLVGVMPLCALAVDGDPSGVTDGKYATSAAISVPATMTQSLLGSAIDGNLTTSYASENTDFADGKEYLQLNWSSPIDINQVVLYCQWCGTATTAGQAPTSWDIYVSADGSTGWEKIASSGTMEWEDNSDVQSKVLDFDTAEDIMGLRVAITSAKLDWGHYCIYELETNYIAGQGDSGDQGGSGDPGDSGDVVGGDPSGVTDGKYATSAAISVPATMTQSLLGSAIDGNLTTSYASENTDFADGKEYLQLNWNSPIDINQVVLYCQWCGTATTAGQAPTSWDIYVSADGSTGWEKIASSGTMEWEGNNDVQAKVLDFDTAEDIMGLRVAITSAKLDWGHYCIYELETNYIAGDNENPVTGDSFMLLPIVTLAILSLCGVLFCLYANKRNAYSR